MQRLHRIVGAAKVSEPLPTVFDRLAANGTHICRGQVTMVAAQSGAGKSNLALYYAVRLAERHQLRTLYFSADTDASTTMVRTACILTGHRFSDVAKQMRGGAGRSYYEDALADLQGRVGFSFESDPSYQDLHAEIMAFHTMWGETYPDLIVVDNLMNVVGENESEWAAMADSMKFLHRVARHTGSAVLVLTHMSEQGKPTGHPLPKQAIQGKLSKIPEVILSLAQDRSTKELMIATVKNRNGPDDDSGTTFSRYKLDFERVQLYRNDIDWQMREAV